MSTDYSGVWDVRHAATPIKDSDFKLVAGHFTKDGETTKCLGAQWRDWPLGKAGGIVPLVVPHPFKEAMLLTLSIMAEASGDAELLQGAKDINEFLGVCRVHPSGVP